MKRFEEELNKRIAGAERFFISVINKLVLALGKGVYSLRIRRWLEKNSETLLPKIEEFYGHLNMEDISTQISYKHANRVWKDFEIKT